MTQQTSTHRRQVRDGLEVGQQAQSAQGPSQQQDGLPSRHNVTRPAPSPSTGSPRKDDRPLPHIPSYIEDHSVQSESGNTQAKLGDSELELLRINPELGLGISGFGVERQMRAIAGHRSLMAISYDRRNDNQAHDHGRGRLVLSEVESGSGNSTCRASGCRGKAWGPHAIHICDFNT